MATQSYGVLDTAFFSNNGWQGKAGKAAPSVDALAIALAMPSVEPSGARAKRGGLKGAGLGSYYMAFALTWGGGGVNDVEFQSFTGQPKVSSKQNHLTGLINFGAPSGNPTPLIQRYKLDNGKRWQVALTDHGVAWCKAVNAELGKAAKAFTVAARDKAIKAAAKAAKPASKPRKPAKVATVTDVPADVPVPVEHQLDQYIAQAE